MDNFNPDYVQFGKCVRPSCPVEFNKRNICTEGTILASLPEVLGLKNLRTGLTDLLHPEAAL